MAVPIVEQTPAVRKAQAEIASELCLLRDRMMRTGLLLTHHAIEEAVKTIGYEMAALQLGTWPEEVWESIEKTRVKYPPSHQGK